MLAYRRSEQTGQTQRSDVVFLALRVGGRLGLQSRGKGEVSRAENATRISFRGVVAMGGYVRRIRFETSQSAK